MWCELFQFSPHSTMSRGGGLCVWSKSVCMWSRCVCGSSVYVVQVCVWFKCVCCQVCVCVVHMCVLSGVCLCVVKVCVLSGVCPCVIQVCVCGSSVCDPVHVCHLSVCSQHICFKVSYVQISQRPLADRGQCICKLIQKNN